MTRRPAYARAPMGVGYMPEDRRLIPEFTVEENILLPQDAVGRVKGRERLDWIYGLMPEIARFADRKALALSGDNRSSSHWRARC